MSAVVRHGDGEAIVFDRSVPLDEELRFSLTLPAWGRLTLRATADDCTPRGIDLGDLRQDAPLGDIRLDAERDGAHVRLTCPGAPQIGAMLSGATVLVTAKDSRAATSQLVLQTNAEAELPVAGLERGAAYELWSPSVQQRLQSDPAWTKRAKGGTWHAFASFVWEGQTSIALQLVRVTQDGD